MGNCCSGDHSKPTEPPLEEEEREYGPDDHPRTSNTSDTATNNTPFFRTPDTMAIESEMEKNFLMQEKLISTSSPSKEERKKMELFEQRLVSLLDFFSHLYVRKKDLFTRVISVRGEELVEVLKKVEQVQERLERPRIQPIQRSRSVGAGEDLKKERMKVKTFKPDEGQPPVVQGTASSSGTKPGGGSK